MVSKCFGMNVITEPFRSLLILVALECFDRYKIDYIRIAEPPRKKCQWIVFRIGRIFGVRSKFAYMQVCHPRQVRELLSLPVQTISCETLRKAEFPMLNPGPVSGLAIYHRS